MGANYHELRQQHRTKKPVIGAFCTIIALFFLAAFIGLAVNLSCEFLVMISNTK